MPRAARVELFSTVSQNYNFAEVVPFPRVGHICVTSVEKTQILAG